mgnify:CR=1 FL=1
METSQRSPISSESQHRRQTRRQIWLPLALGIGILAAAAGLMMSPLFPPANRAGISLVADWVLSVLVLCPTALCLFPITAGLLIAAFGLNIIHDSAARPLRRGVEMTDGLAARARQWADSISRATIAVSARLAYGERLLSMFDRPSPTPEKDTIRDQ